MKDLGRKLTKINFLNEYAKEEVIADSLEQVEIVQELEEFEVSEFTLCCTVHNVGLVIRKWLVQVHQFFHRKPVSPQVYTSTCSGIRLIAITDLSILFSK